MPCSWQSVFRARRRYPHLHGMFRRARLRHVAPTSACCDRSVVRKAARQERERSRCRREQAGSGASVTLVALAAASVSLGAGSAQAAVVYCKTVGVPKGCVVQARPPSRRPPWSRPPRWASHALVSARPGVGVRAGHADESRRSGQPRRKALTLSMIRKSGHRFSEKIMRKR